jgi:hypothetical protein
MIKANGSTNETKIKNLKREGKIKTTNIASAMQ